MDSSRGGRWGSRAVQNRRYDRLANLDPLEFERVVADYYRRQGYAVEHCGTGGGRNRFDGGIDLKMYRDGKYTIVQCKRENARQVTHNVGHELLGVLLTEKADHAIVVNTGEFTPHAIATARKESRLQLIDGNELRRKLPEYSVPAAGQASAASARSGLDWPLSGPPARPAPVRVRSGSAKRESQDGTKALISLVVLAAIVLWQCSTRSIQNKASQTRSVPETGHAPASATQPPPAVVEVTSTPIVQEAASLRTREPVRRDPVEAQRRAEEASRILEATTPEMDLFPDSHSVYREGDP